MHMKVKDGFYHSLNLYFTMRPVSNVSITIGPGYTFNLDKAQWVDVFSDSDMLAFQHMGRDIYLLI